MTLFRTGMALLVVTMQAVGSNGPRLLRGKLSEPFFVVFTLVGGCGRKELQFSLAKL